MSEVTVLQYGLGPIGVAIARVAAARPGLCLVGGVDVDPAKAGRSLAEVIGAPVAPDALVWGSAVQALAASRPRVALHSTGSALTSVLDQLLGLVQAGTTVISTCEELAYPYAAHADEAARLDAAARDNGVVVLGTGVNPGFVMDTLVAELTAVAERIERIEVNRTVDAARRRLPLQKKIGAGLELDEFRRLAAAGTIRHVGLEESVRLVAAALGWEVEQLASSIEPLVAERERRSAELTARVGQAAGVHQRIVARVAGEERLIWDLKMLLEADDPCDEIRITGEPPLHLRLAGGIHGDVATAAIMVNAIPRVLAARPGLRTMLELPSPTCWSRLERP